MAVIPQPIKKVHIDRNEDNRTLSIYFGSVLVKNYIRAHCSSVEGYYKGTTFDTFLVSPVYDINQMIEYIHTLAEEVVEEGEA